MSEEIKNTQEHKCLCQNEYVRKFFVVAFGTFVGGFCAISLFAALNKPPMMPVNPMMQFPPQMHYMMHKHPGFDCDCPCHKKMMKKHFDKKMEFYKEMKENKETKDKD